MAITAFKPVCDIAGVRAVLTVPVSIGREPFSAVGAVECVDGFPVDLFRVGVPPAESAGVRAEPDFLSTGNLFYWLSAVLAVGAIRRILVACVGNLSGEVVPAAKG
jgi:hypothetical protein